MCLGKRGRDVFMADSAFILQMAQDEFREIKFHFSSEF
jgi:peptide chain release factor 3